MSTNLQVVTIEFAQIIAEAKAKLEMIELIHGCQCECVECLAAIEAVVSVADIYGVCVTHPDCQWGEHTDFVCLKCDGSVRESITY